jgi:hypothetical protein
MRDGEVIASRLLRTVRDAFHLTAPPLVRAFPRESGGTFLPTRVFFLYNSRTMRERRAV